jgi:hypothetical protein
VIAHGAPPPASVAELEATSFTRGGELLSAALTRYGLAAGEYVELLRRLGPEYHLLIHGHDRDEEGFNHAGPASALLCTSFGARRDRKAYLWLDLGRRYGSPDDLREGIELRRLYR